MLRLFLEIDPRQEGLQQRSRTHNFVLPGCWLLLVVVFQLLQMLASLNCATTVLIENDTSYCKKRKKEKKDLLDELSLFTLGIH